MHLSKKQKMSLKFSGLRQLFAFLCENVGRGAVLKGQSSTYETFFSQRQDDSV